MAGAGVRETVRSAHPSFLRHRRTLPRALDAVRAQILIQQTVFAGGTTNFITGTCEWKRRKNETKQRNYIRLTLTGAVVGNGKIIGPPPTRSLFQPAHVLVAPAVRAANRSLYPLLSVLLAIGGTDALGPALSHDALLVRAAIDSVAGICPK